MRRLALCVAWLATAAILAAHARAAQAPPSISEDEFFQIDRVWSMHLSLTAEQWSAIQPTFNPQGSPGDGYLGAEGGRNGRAAAMGYDFPWGQASLEIDGRRFDSIALRHKGNGSFLEAEGDKLPFKIDLNEHVKGQKIGRISTFNLHNNVSDATWMRDVLAYRLFRDAGVPTPRTAYARVFVTVPNRYARKYLGLYSLVENVDQDFVVDRFGPKTGALLKPVMRRTFPDLGNTWDRYNQTFDPKTTLTAADQARIIEFCKFVVRARDDDFARRLGEFVDLDRFARFLAVLVWLANPDSLIDNGQNFYMYLDPETRQFHFIPWDNDKAFGHFWAFAPETLQALPIDAPSRRGDNLFIERVLKVKEFKARYHAELSQLATTLFAPTRLADQVNALAEVLRPAVAEESAERLQWFNASALGKPYLRPLHPYPVASIKTFAAARTASVLAQLAKAAARAKEP